MSLSEETFSLSFTSSSNKTNLLKIPLLLTTLRVAFQRFCFLFRMSNPPASTSAASHEPHPDPNFLTGNGSQDSVNYEPQPSKSLPLSPHRQEILRAITSFYSGSASESDMRIYSEDAVYDDPLSYCDSRYKIAGQWYGIPKLFKTFTTLSTEVVKSSPAELVFKLRQEYVFQGGVAKKVVDSLVSLGLSGEEGKEVVKYHKDMWNDKDYSHQGVGFLFKKMNGDYLTGVTQPPESL